MEGRDLYGLVWIYMEGINWYRLIWTRIYCD